MSSVPLVVVGGYLGAGKTTLVNHLLRGADGRRVAVLVNDFGAISLDAGLIEGAADGVLALAGGCVCCSFGDDLIGSLQRVAARDPAPDVMLLECSGVGLPGAVARTAALARGVGVEGVVVVVDGAQVQRQARDRYVGDTVRRQLREADLLLLNQQDRCTPDEQADRLAWLAELVPGTPVAPCAFGRVPPALVLGLRTLPEKGTARWQGTGGRYRRPAAAAEARFVAYERACPEPVDPQAFARALIDGDPGLLRAKGVVRGLDGRRWRLQIMGRRVEIDPEAREAVPAGRMLCIGVKARAARCTLAHSPNPPCPAP